MTCRRFLVTCLSAGALLATSLVAQTAPATSSLTIEEAIQRALRRNFDLEIQRFGPQIAADSVEVAKDIFTPTVTATTSHRLTRSNSSVTNIGSKSETTDTRLGVSQRLATGATVSVSTVVDRSESNPALGTLNPAYNADVSVSIRQPLLDGAGSAINRAGIERSELGLRRAQFDLTTRALDVIQSTEFAYYNLVFAREQLEVRKFSLALAQRLLDEARTRRDTGVATDLDVLQAEVGVANARRAVLLSEQSSQDRTDSLLALIGQFEFESGVGSTSLPAPAQSLPLLASSLQAAKQNQPEYLSAQLALEQAQIDLRVSKNATLPSLSVGGAVGFDGRNNDRGGALSDALEREGSSWQFDLSLSYPWGQKGDKARYRQGLAAVSQQTLRLRQLEQNIEVQVRSAVRAVETNAENLKISSFARELSDRQYELEKAKFDAGLSTSRRVLEAQDDLEVARINELQARVNLRTSIASLYRIEASSLQRYGLTVQ